MADVSFGLVGDSTSYFPLSRDRVVKTNRGNVDVVKLPVGSHYNKVYWPLGITDYSGNADSEFLVPDRNDSLKIIGVYDDNGDKVAAFNQPLTKVGFRKSKFVYLSYMAPNSTVDNTYVGLNHNVVLEVAKRCAGVRGMTMIFDVDLPKINRVLRSGQQNGPMYRSLNAGYTMRNRSSGDSIEIVVSDHQSLVEYSESGSFLWVRLIVRKNGEVVVDRERGLFRAGANDYRAVVGEHVDRQGSSFNFSLPVSKRYNTDSDLGTLNGYDYEQTYYSNSLRSPKETSVINGQGRVIGHFEFNYNGSKSSLFMSGYFVNTSVYTSVTEGNTEKFRVKIWEGDPLVDLGSFDVDYKVQSDRRNAAAARFDNRDSIMPIEIATDYFRLLYPGLYETFRVRRV